MERKQFLEMCQRCATLPSGTLGVKDNVPDDLKVVYKDIVYYPIYYILSFDEKGTPRHIGVLHDLNANSIVSGDLENIKLYKNTEE